MINETKQEFFFYLIWEKYGFNHQISYTQPVSNRQKGTPIPYCLVSRFFSFPCIQKLTKFQ